eukprot:TRINITY_DN16637_c0_g1_i1.p1 TRINITY_DN16637_c0_g1~~TRINITY_DN16637_c0_g1_i1.p1  ORF type:complete len:466 (+),score=104.26 TRINITY_DN16637_c0_g1_i1:107-1504(+)
MCIRDRRQLHAAMLSPSAVAQAKYVDHMSSPAPYADSSSRLLHVDWDRQRWVAGGHGGAGQRPNGQTCGVAASNTSDNRNQDLLLQRVSASNLHDASHLRQPQPELSANQRYNEQNLNKGLMHEQISDWSKRDAPRDQMGWKGVFHETTGGDQLGGKMHDRYSSLYEMWLAADKDRSGYLDRIEIKDFLRSYLPTTEAEKMFLEMDEHLDGFVSYGEFVRFFHAHESKHRNPGRKFDMMEELPIHHQRQPEKAQTLRACARDDRLRERHQDRALQQTSNPSQLPAPPQQSHPHTPADPQQQQPGEIDLMAMAPPIGTPGRDSFSPGQTLDSPSWLSEEHRPTVHRRASEAQRLDGTDPRLHTQSTHNWPAVAVDTYHDNAQSQAPQYGRRANQPSQDSGEEQQQEQHYDPSESLAPTRKKLPMHRAWRLDDPQPAPPRCTMCTHSECDPGDQRVPRTTQAWPCRA